MRADELIQLLHKYGNQEVLVKIGDGLYCPIIGVSTCAKTAVIIGKDVRLSVIDAPFEQPKFKPSVKTVYITEQK